MAFAQELEQCPACQRYVTTLASNGICHNCPEVKKWISLVGSNREHVAAGVSRYNRKRGHAAIVQRPAGRSGRVTKWNIKDTFAGN